MLPINLVAVSIAALSAFILGFLFHGPLFGKLWMKLANIHPTGNEKFSDMIPQLFWNFVSNFATASALALVIWAGADLTRYGYTSREVGMLLGGLAWIGFLVPSSSIEVIWMGRSVKHWLFEVCCSGVIMIVMGAIIGGW